MEQLCIITGGGTGIGAALALRLAARSNIKVLISGRRQNTLDNIQRENPQKIFTIQSDVSNAEDRSKIVNKVKDQYNLKFLVHNAAVIQPVCTLENLTVQEWRKHQSINLEGPLFLTQALLPFMNDTRVLNISSGAAHNPYQGWAAYCLSKSALFMLYKLFKEENKDKNIHFGSLRPGVVDTPMQNIIRKSSESAFPALNRFIKMKKTGKLADPDHVAKFIEWVLCETTNDAFSAGEWNIRDQEHHHSWNG